MEEYGIKTKCRAIFVNTICMYYDYMIELDETFFTQLHYFAKDLLVLDFDKYIDDLDLIIFFKYNKGVFIPFEQEWTISNLFNQLDKIHTYNDLLPLYDEIGQDKVNRITNLANEFIRYQNFMNSIPHSHIIQ